MEQTNHTTPSVSPLKGNGFSIHGFQAALKGVVRIALLTHAFFIVFFFACGVIPLAVLNIASTLVYALCLRLLKISRTRTIVWMVWAEVITHTTLAVLWLGWDSGFH